MKFFTFLTTLKSTKNVCCLSLALLSVQPFIQARYLEFNPTLETDDKIKSNQSTEFLHVKLDSVGKLKEYIMLLLRRSHSQVYEDLKKDLDTQDQTHKKLIEEFKTKKKTSDLFMKGIEGTRSDPFFIKSKLPFDSDILSDLLIETQMMGHQVNYALYAARVAALLATEIAEEKEEQIRTSLQQGNTQKHDELVKSAIEAKIAKEICYKYAVAVDGVYENLINKRFAFLNDMKAISRLQEGISLAKNTQEIEEYIRALEENINKVRRDLRKEQEETRDNIAIAQTYASFARQAVAVANGLESPLDEKKNNLLNTFFAHFKQAQKKPLECQALDKDGQTDAKSIQHKNPPPLKPH